MFECGVRNVCARLFGLVEKKKFPRTHALMRCVLPQHLQAAGDEATKPLRSINRENARARENSIAPWCR
jgi:hypothetical protein